MPTEIVACTARVFWLMRNGSPAMRLRNRSATEVAMATLVSGMTTTNSSPPKRQARSMPRTAFFSRRENSLSTSSPAEWP
jgi:hypothetical protein